MSRIFDYAANASIAFLVTLVVLAIACPACGGEEESCLGPIGSFEGGAELSVYNCTGVPATPPLMKLEVERDSYMRACGWHDIGSATIVRSDGCTVEERRSLNTTMEGYWGTVFAEISCPGNARKCGAFWEIDFKEAP